MDKVGFIGLGNMGLPMARNILKGGYTLSIYNRTKDKGLSLIEEGARWTDSPADLASKCDIMITMVANDNALKEIIEGPSGIFHSEKKPAIHISMSTISPELSIILEEKHREHGISFLAAPVTGRPERAQKGSLWIFLSGKAEAKKIAHPILEKMSVRVYDLGEKPQQACLFKLCNNFMILSLIESFAEASTMLEKEGISKDKAAEIWGTSLFDSVVFHAYTPMICKGNFADGGFALDLGLKDMRLLRVCADKAQMPMPFLSDLHEKLLISMNLGRAKYDWSAIAMVTKEQSGIK